jgi:PAS domain-containing protein
MSSRLDSEQPDVHDGGTILLKPGSTVDTQPLTAKESPPAVFFFHERLLDSLYDGVYFVDCGRKITYWNQSAEQLTGYSADEAIGKHRGDPS